MSDTSSSNQAKIKSSNESGRIDTLLDAISSVAEKLEVLRKLMADVVNKKGIDSDKTKLISLPFLFTASITSLRSISNFSLMPLTVISNASILSLFFELFALRKLLLKFYYLYYDYATGLNKM